MPNTTNLNLFLPTRNDTVNVLRDLDDNFQKIDDAYGNLNSKITNMVETKDLNSTKVTNLNDIPSGTMGVVKLNSTVSPSGADGSFVYMKPYGAMIMATATGNANTWITTKTAGSWLAWKKISYAS